MNLKKRFLSQNFFKDPKLVTNLVGLAHFGLNDTVVEVGAGRGIITFTSVSNHTTTNNQSRTDHC